MDIKNKNRFLSIKALCPLWFILFIFAVASFANVHAARRTVQRPNILWFYVDDMSANFSSYGETLIETPNVDKLAQQGVKFSRAYATSPVCSTFRSSLITGMYQASIGVHHHRSGRGKEHRIILPQGVRPLPAIFQEGGYFTCMGSGLENLDFRTQPFKSAKRGLGKIDYNFEWDRTIFDSHDWAGRKKGQPFFMQVQLHGGKLRGASTAGYEQFDKQVMELFGNITDPQSVALPPYYPRDPLLLKDWSTYLDSVRVTDYHVGLVMERLKREGVLDNTIVIFFTDHGISHARGKQFLYDEGTHIPLIISGPGIERAKTRGDLVEHIDIAALSLALAGIKIPEKMEGRNILTKSYKAKQAVFGAQDRCGEAADRIRSVRSKDYLYIKNFYPDRPHLMPSGYKDGKIIVKRLRALHAQGKLSKLSEKLLFSATRPSEELYLYRNDVWQTKNLADDSAYAAVLKEHRKSLENWITETGDMGSETLEVYQMEIDDQMQSMRNKNAREIYRKNAEIYKRWMQSGK